MAAEEHWLGLLILVGLLGTGLPTLGMGPWAPEPPGIRWSSPLASHRVPTYLPPNAWYFLPSWEVVGVPIKRGKEGCHGCPFSCC